MMIERALRSDSPDCVDRLLSIVASVSLFKTFSIETSSILCLPLIVLSDLSPVTQIRVDLEG
jgi:hypothetical protein